jgi:hypothetical protein
MEIQVQQMRAEAVKVARELDKQAKQTQDQKQ